MSSAAGSGYHHGNLRASLVDAGLELARAEGPDGVVLRAVARRVGVSHNAAYRHFADRQALLAEIADRAMEQLSDAMRARLAAIPADLDPVARARRRLEELGRAYVGFALAEPGLFRAAFSAFPVPPDGGPPEVAPDPGSTPVDDAGEAGAGPYDLLNLALDDLVVVGWLPEGRRPGAELLCWAAVHGFAALHLDGPLNGEPATEREEGLARVLTLIDAGLGAPA